MLAKPLAKSGELPARFADFVAPEIAQQAKLRPMRLTALRGRGNPRPAARSPRPSCERSARRRLASRHAARNERGRSDRPAACRASMSRRICRRDRAHRRSGAQRCFVDDLLVAPISSAGTFRTSSSSASCGWGMAQVGRPSRPIAAAFGRRRGNGPDREGGRFRRHEEGSSAEPKKLQRGRVPS